MKYGIDYHPSLFIIEHFTALVFKLDVHVETILLEFKDSVQSSKINQKRSDFISTINSIQSKNLTHFTANKETIEAKCLEIENENLPEAVFLEQIKSAIIKYDCFLVKNLACINRTQHILHFDRADYPFDTENLGYSLVCTPWYNDLKSIETLE